jgi:hypothetical protein
LHIQFFDARYGVGYLNGNVRLLDETKGIACLLDKRLSVLTGHDGFILKEKALVGITVVYFPQDDAGFLNPVPIAELDQVGWIEMDGLRLRG